MTRLLRTYAPRVRLLLLGVLVFQSAQVLLILTMPGITADIIDRGVIPADTSYIWSRGIWLLVVTLAQMTCSMGGVYFGARSAMEIGRAMRHDLFRRVLAFSAREVHQFGAPTLITRITNDVQHIQIMVMTTCQMAVVAPITAALGMTMAVRQDAGLSRVVAVAIPVFGLPMALLLVRMHPVFTRMQDQMDDANRVLREQITGIRVVRAFVREEAERQRFRVSNDALTASGIATGRIMAMMFPLTLFMQNAASVAVVWVGAGRIASGATTVGGLFALLGYVAQVLMAVVMSMFAVMMLPRASVAGRRIREVLDTRPSVETPAAPARGHSRGGLIEASNIRFGYPGADAAVLDDITFVARPGQTTAIIGGTGSGKTTLVNLVARLMDVTAGELRIDGIDVRDFELTELWQRVGLVPQKPFLFRGSVADNLRYGSQHATEDEMWEALNVAQAAEFVAAMPDGLDTRISQGGVNVSGGQRQRLAIARALIRKPDIYLFDDSLSALDLATDARLRAALAPHTVKSTVLIVAQRVSTIVDADQIVVLDGGQAVGVGTHAELLTTCATYAEFVASQLSTTDAT